MLLTKHDSTLKVVKNYILRAKPVALADLGKLEKHYFV